jgi:hypothetical protein
MQQGNASAQGGSARARVSAAARASATRGRGRAARGRPRNVQRTSRGNALVDDAASLSGEDNGQEEIEDEENDRDRAFVDDDEQSMSSSVNGYRAPSENRFARDGPRVSYDPEEPKTKKERRMPRVLQALQPLGLYCDYVALMPFAKHVARMSHLVSPYSWYSHFTDPRCVTYEGIVGDNEFMSPSLASWMQDKDAQLQFANLFASYGHTSHGAQEERLRNVRRMVLTGPTDDMHFRVASAVSEVICAHNVLNERDELDTQPCPDVADEFVCKGDFLSERKLRGGCSSGGLPGLPSLVLFVFEESTGCMDVSNAILRIFKYWNLGASRPELLSGHIHAVQTETTEFYKNIRTNSRSARVSVKPIRRDKTHDSKAMLGHVHPDLLRKINGPSVHQCRSSSFVDSSEDADRIVHSLFECQLHVVPSRVRDSSGKTRFVVASILRIRSTVPGCDPVVALRGLQALQGFSQELVNVTQHMVRLLHFHGDVSTDRLFDVCQDDDRPNLAAIGHEANLPLAFFNFLRLKQMSCAAPSPFAADWMGQRIDVYDEAEVALFLQSLKVAHYSRKKYYALATLHTSHDQKDMRNAQLHIPTTSVDWKLFFPGQHFRAVPREALRREFDEHAAAATSEQTESFEDFMQHNTHPTHIFLPCDGVPYTRGYVCVTQPTMRPEDNTESIKLKQQQVFKEGDTRQDELQCVHYCSKRFQIYSTFAMSARDPYGIFMEADTPYPTVNAMRENINALSSIEREYFGYLTNAPDQGMHMQRERMKTKLINTVYGLSDHVMHSELLRLYASSDTSMMLEHTHDLIATHVNKHMHVCANAPMQHLKHAARFLIDLQNVDDNPPRTDANQNIAQQHLVLHTQVNNGVLNDDAQAARREIQQFCTFQSELNVVNYAVVRWLLLAHVSVWSSTIDGCYGYCIQICDMGNSVRVCMKKSAKFADDDMMEWDLKTPGSGADMAWNIFGEYINGYPKFLARTAKMRDFFSGNNVCELYQQKSLMSFKRQNGIVKNVHDCVMDSMSEHNQNMGIVGAMNELNKLEQDSSKINAIWPTLEAGLGQSGSTLRGVQEKPFTTTLSGVVVNISVLNPLQVICLASNLLSVGRPPSVNDGSRVVPMTSGCDDSLGRIVDRNHVPVSAPTNKRRKKGLGVFTSDIQDIRDPRRVDEPVVRRNMSMFLMEYMARIFALMHRGLCLKRSVNSGFGMFLWSNTRNCCMHLTTNLRKATYVADDKMARNVNGSLETAVFSKWVRSVLQVALHRRLMQTTCVDTAEAQTQIRHVLADAITTFMLVPISTAVLLSAMQIYLTMVVLDVGVMLVSCMTLYYLDVPCNCPMHVMALVIRGHESDLCAADRQQYHDFAAHLHSKLLRAVVALPCLGTSFTPQKISALIEKHGDAGMLQSCGAQTPPSVYLCDTYFPAMPPKREKLEANPTVSQILATSFCMTQGITSETCKARLFWSNAGPGTRIPIPTNKANDRHHRQFQALNECPRFYNDLRNKLRSQPDRDSNFGVLINFLRTCDLPEDCSRYDLVTALLRPWAQSADVSLDGLHDALHTQDGLAEDWARPIFNDKRQIDASMLEWAVRIAFHNSWEYNASVGLAVDVLWVLVSQALFAGEWRSSPTERVSIVHTRNMSGAAQALVCLYLHTSVPKAAIPACVAGGVVLSEPSNIPSNSGEAICIPYYPRLHVDSGHDGAGFLNSTMRQPRHMRVVATTDGPRLVSRYIQLLDRETNDIGTDILAQWELCPFPPESVAHMLPAMPSLMRTFRRMLQQHPTLANIAECQWAVAMRLFGSSAEPNTIGFLPVSLTMHALDEDIPCFTYKHGFCFVLRIDGTHARLIPVVVNTTFVRHVDDAKLLAHGTFSQLPLATDSCELCFPAEQLSHAMAGGLVLCDGLVEYTPPQIFCALTEPRGVQVPFTFMPIIRFQCLLMLELLDATHAHHEQYPTGKRPYPESRAAQLTVAVLNTHPDSSTFLLHGEYHMRYYDSLGNESATTVDYIFASQCMLCDGRAVFYTFTAEQFRDLLEHIDDPDNTCENTHIDTDGPFAPDEQGHDDFRLEDGFALQCHYTFSHEPRKATLAGNDGARVRIALTVAHGNASQQRLSVMYADVPLFDSSHNSRLHIHAPDMPVVLRFVY